MQPLQKYSEYFEFSDDNAQLERAIVQLLFHSINYYYIYCIFYVIHTITVLLFIMSLTWNYFNILQLINVIHESVRFINSSGISQSVLKDHIIHLPPSPPIPPSSLLFLSPFSMRQPYKVNIYDDLYINFPDIAALLNIWHNEKDSFRSCPFSCTISHIRLLL